MRDIPAVFGTAGRLFLRHWPALLVLSLLGAALRNGAVYAAIRLSDIWGQLGILMLVLAPLGFLLPMVAMLTVCRESLPALQVAAATPETAPTERRPLRLLDVAVSVLVPFLAVYSSYGLLEDDLHRFRNIRAANDVATNGFGVADDFHSLSRLGIYPVKIAVLIVVGAWLVRFLIGRAERSLRWRALAYVGAFVEVYYTAQLAGQLQGIKVFGADWLRDRKVAHWVQGWYDAVADVLGPVAGVFKAAVGGVEAAFGSFEAVVVVPVGWLALAAVVLGYRLMESEAEPAPEDRPRRLAWLRDELRERWSALAEGVRLLAAGGLVPMLFFAVVFLVVTRVPWLVHHLARAVVGPQEFYTWVAIEPFETALSYALTLAVSAPMLAAAVDWLIRKRAARRSQESTTTLAPV